MARPTDGEPHPGGSRCGAEREAFEAIEMSHHLRAPSGDRAGRCDGDGSLRRRCPVRLAAGTRRRGSGLRAPRGRGARRCLGPVGAPGLGAGTRRCPRRGGFRRHCGSRARHLTRSGRLGRGVPAGRQRHIRRRGNRRRDRGFAPRRGGRRCGSPLVAQRLGGDVGAIPDGLGCGLSGRLVRRGLTIRDRLGGRRRCILGPNLVRTDRRFRRRVLARRLRDLDQERPRGSAGRLRLDPGPNEEATDRRVEGEGPERACGPADRRPSSRAPRRRQVRRVGLS